MQEKITNLENILKSSIEKTGFSTITNSITLASNSPRRKDYISSFTKHMEILSVHCEESFSDLLTLRPLSSIAYYIALEKALSINLDNIRTRFVITADTLVYYNTPCKVLGKPIDKEDAREMLHFHLGKTHQVTTACVIIDLVKKSFSPIIDSAQIEFHSPTQEILLVIENYLLLKAPLGPLDKAGAYGYQEDLVRQHLIKSVNGDSATIVGFPLEKFTAFWKKEIGKSSSHTPV